MNQPTPDPSQEGSTRFCLFPSWEGLGVGSWSQCAVVRPRGLSMNPGADPRKALPARCRQHLDGVPSPIGGYGCCVAVISTSMKHLIDSLARQAYRSWQPPLMAADRQF